MRKKVDYRTGSRASYDQFRRDNPDIDISFACFQEIIYSFSYMLRDAVLTTGEVVRIPFGMGELSINKNRTRKYNLFNRIVLPIDWPQTMKEGHYIYHHNEHTEGYKFKWIWFRNAARFKYSKFWQFKPNRSSSRTLARYLKTPNSNYQYIYREFFK